MPYNILGDLKKKEIVQKLNYDGYNVKTVHALNLILESLGIVKHSDDMWITTEKGSKYTPYRGSCNADAWHSSIIELVKTFLDKE